MTVVATASNVSNVPWHKPTWDKFSKALDNKHLPHAILLFGAKGAGKLILANKMVKALLCTQAIMNEACNNCQSCKTYESGANPDFMQIELLEGKQQIGVDQIRKLSQFLNYSRSFEGYRVIFINPIERLNKNAANSLLKSLEEPADNTIIIILANNLSSVLPTITSRCQVLSLPMPSNDDAEIWLSNKGIDSEKHSQLLELAYGSPLLASSIPDDLILQRKEFYTDIYKVMCEQASLTEIAKKWEKENQETLLDWQIVLIQKLIKSSHTKLESDNNSLTTQITQKVAEKNYWPLLQQLTIKKQIIHTSVNPLINLESMLILWIQAALHK